MSEHRARITWTRGSAPFDYESYPRGYTLRFEGGIAVPGSAAREFRGKAASEESGAAVDPEQAFVASASSCHMLTFLAIAARKRLVVDRYEDTATGHLEKNEDGKLAVTRIELRPRVVFADPAQVGAQVLERLHRSAHEHCFIANSVRTRIDVLPADPEEA